VLYWTVQNILSTAQQLYINWLRSKKETDSAQPPVSGKPGGKPGLKVVAKTVK